ncbi:uncharacterized protein [Spinacia oleracea]|uniref:Uncharacterized protein LOC110782490 n=2 Tax=Spinacia oleracea TaxID=3562 RepID=A0A9R0I6G3_SPIOL|nr:uncharacterized protein LOC110782490 isoform X1 [Spinacia oleracea]XP_021842359.1 uncharacterized protein LOC110782490 [Spinacia oleracea]XP_021859368.1 uncharacterized protein LOC110798498 isoform X1 [Spinacia oleracea]XP_056682735.1 uncharacterized protein LOC110798498 isoform X1 [Spinacia oleracea]XP_056682736.1 uncharacterized protein LOC110798498 isoform X1 [Spinacia oleracea]XP_056697258.1 uncharacterized protein LOC110782490 isoform X1 [Spinacia oleracea]XP_056697259.1 uncharacteriz
MESGDEARHRRLLRRFILIQRRNRARNNNPTHVMVTDSRPRHLPVIWPQHPMPSMMNAVQRVGMDNGDEAKHRRLLRRFILIQRRNRARNNNPTHVRVTDSRPRHLPVIWPQHPVASMMNAVERAHRSLTSRGETSAPNNNVIGSGTPSRRRRRSENRESTSSLRRRLNSSLPPDGSMTPTTETDIQNTRSPQPNLNRVGSNISRNTLEGSASHALHHRKYTRPWTFGGPKHVCSHCGARVWIQERVKREKRVLEVVT